MPVTMHLQRRAFYRRFFAAFIAAVCVFAWVAELMLTPHLAYTAQQGSGYYGTPLKFDPPPVDMGGGSVDTERDEEFSLPAPVEQKTQQQQRPARQRNDSSGHALPEQPEKPAVPAPAVPEPVQESVPPPELEPAPAKGSDAGDIPQVAPEPQTQAPVPEAQAGASGRTRGSKPIRLFGTVEFRCIVKDLPKWQRVYRSEKKAPSFTASGLSCKTPEMEARWQALKAKLQDAPLMEKAKGVNSFFNQWPYKIDKMLWGLEDYWATPCEFIKKSGDCEDYAIAKYYALRDLGVPANLMRIAAVKNTISGIGHAVMVIFIDNGAYVLDNMTNLVLSHTRLSHYRPLYTVNEEYMWRHVKPVAGPKN